MGWGISLPFQNILAKHICCVFSCHSNVSNCLLLKTLACDDIQVDRESHCVFVCVHASGYGGRAEPCMLLLPWGDSYVL